MIVSDHWHDFNTLRRLLATCQVCPSIVARVCFSHALHTGLCVSERQRFIIWYLQSISFRIYASARGYLIRCLHEDSVFVKLHSCDFSLFLQSSIFSSLCGIREAYAALFLTMAFLEQYRLSNIVMSTRTDWTHAVFCGMQLNGDSRELQDHHSVSCDTALGAWVKRWNHWRRHGTTQCPTSSFLTGMRYILYSEYTDYVL